MTAGPPRSNPRAPRLEGDAHQPRHAAPRTAETPEASGWVPSTDPAVRRASDKTQLSHYVVSHLRTFVPLAWGAAVTWALGRWVPDVAATVATDPTILAALTSLVAGGWYALWRGLEPRLPRAVVALLLGHSAEPAYPE